MAVAFTVAVTASILIGACGGSGAEIVITVSAASSLRAAGSEIEAAFEATHPAVDVRLNFDSSSTLARQIERGAPVDVFVAADDHSMDRLVERGLVDGPPVGIATNRMAVVVKPGNPDGVQSINDLAGIGVVALCDESAPCGHLATGILERAGASLPPQRVTRTANASATLTAVEQGDARAAIVFVTDALAAGDRVTTIEIPPELSATTTYSAAALARSDPPAQSRQLIEFLRSPDATGILERHGFGVP